MTDNFMNRIRLRLFHAALLAGVLLASGVSLTASAQTQGRARFDVTNYRIEAQLLPAEHVLHAAAEVTFTPLESTRSVVFELNGSLKVEGIMRNGKPLTNFVQDL
jgi:hypothetical protein